MGAQQKVSGLFGQSPMLGGSSSVGTVLGTGLLGQTTGAGGGLFNKPQTSGTGLLGAGLGQTGVLGQSSSTIFGETQVEHILKLREKESFEFEMSK